MIEYIKGDLFSTDVEVIVHGCNNKGVMGSGVAKIIRDKYPEAYKEYKSTSEIGYNKYNRDLPLGCIIPKKTNNKHIINAITQDGYGRDNYKYVSYDAVDDCMINLNSYCLEHNLSTVAMPKIGAGLGGGNWEVIAAIIEHRLVYIRCKIYII